MRYVVSAEVTAPWNKGLLVGQKKPLEPKHVLSIRVHLEIAQSLRDRAIFNLAIDSKLRARGQPGPSIIDPKFFHPPASQRLSCICLIGKWSVGLVFKVIPGISTDRTRSLRLLA